MKQPDRYRVGIDVGGTFTDVTVLEEATGRIREVRKVPSNPAAPLDGARRRAGGPGRQVGRRYLVLPAARLHPRAQHRARGERQPHRPAYHPAAFRDVYEIARQWKGHEVFNIFYPGAKRFVPRRRVAEVAERLDKSGDVLVPLDLDTVDEAVAGLMDQGIEALGHCVPVFLREP